MVTYEDVTANVEAWLKDQPRGTRKKLAAVIGVDKTGFSHRMSGRYHFSVEELLKIADAVGAPPGWPLVPFALAERLGALEVLLAGKK